MATPDITITDIADLQSAYDTLSNGGGGTIAIAADDTPLRLMLRDGGGDDAVRIVSADPDAPTLLHQIDLVGVENVTVSGFRVDSTGVDRPDWYDDLRVSGGENITIENTVFTSNAEGRYDPAFEGAILGETFADIRGTDGLTLSGNTVSNYFQGLTVRESTDVQISDNEFTQMQGDGIRLAGVQDVDVTGNHLHNFLGTTHSFNHNDFIQVWSTNTTLTTKNLTISNNIIDAGDGSGGQAIFIGNERAAQGQDHRYENIEVSDNLIHTASRHGITVASADGVKIEDNTVLWNEAARIVVNPGEDGTS
ncbi:MAG: right-handed parallel beta-helix repeat-containing protein, partial [Pseudomonadota bacterium]